MSFTESDLGFFLVQDNHMIFFGKNNATLDKLKQSYPDIEFRTVHQKHTDICVTSKPESQEIVADAHYTTEAGVGLVVKTADCLPILAFSKSQQLLVAIHAGWRGVENQLTAKSLLTAKLNEAEIFIGPHILQKSFEVDLDVKEQLEKVYLLHTQNPDTAVFTAKENKYYIDLKAIVRKQIDSVSIPYHLHELALDTVSDPRLHSYRRDRQTSGRNLSFIARLKS